MVYRTDWAPLVRAGILERKAKKGRSMTLRSFYYLMLWKWAKQQEEVYRAQGKSLPKDLKQPTWGSLTDIVRSIEEEDEQPIADSANLTRKDRGMIFLAGQEMVADKAAMERLHQPWVRGVLLVEKEDLARVIAQETEGTRIAVFAHEGVPVKAHQKTIQKLVEEGKAVRLLTDFDAGGVRIGKAAKVPRLEYKTVKEAMAAQGVSWDLKQVVQPDFGDEKGLGGLTEEELRLFRDLGAQIGFDGRGKIEADVLQAVAEAAEKPWALGRSLKGLFPEEAQKPPDAAMEMRGLLADLDALRARAARLRQLPLAVVLQLRFMLAQILRQLGG